MPIEHLTVEARVDAGVNVIAAAGEVDHGSVPLLSDALRRVTLEAEGPVVVDLCDVSFIDSSGISTLLNALRRLTRQRRKMVVVCPPGPLRRVFEMLGLLGTFELLDSRESALAVAESGP